ncbi:hypothetical protein PQ455_02995 [Sphingomonas naphthae]|uniref:MarR family transcriptional regulator n=1 Tax=Sphingomonas naphthae TaxID=1813468 RepID=A0ABY7TMH5_9SPHN|nr:hypothetical protein [Sphingomonas naphthae]WCT74213.1 hypothetical protein PQ455_02995 [Sphingomonas naphthae]
MGESGYTTRWQIDRLLSRLPLEDTERATIDRLLEGATSRFEMAPKAGQPVTVSALGRDLYKVSRRFEQLVGAHMAANPVWNMMLDLLVAEEDGTRVSVTSLCIASGEPTTSALRHISQLERLGWVTRVADDTDHRRSWVSLTGEAADKMRRTLADIYNAGTRGEALRWEPRAVGRD